MKKCFFFLFFSMFLISCEEKTESSAERSEIIQKIARANGIDHFKEANRLQYTFNVKVNDTLRTSRTWEWHPKTGEVKFIPEDSVFTYNHQSEAEDFPEIDQKFINDQYWLLFPFHLVWDEMEHEYISEATAPVSGEKMQKLIVKYPAEAGYTPGDVYEVYFDNENLIREWTYLRGGSRENPFSATWEGYKNFNGMKISTMHKNSSGNFQLYFTGIEVE